MPPQSSYSVVKNLPPQSLNHGWFRYKKAPPRDDGTFIALTSRLRQGAGDGAEGVADLGSKQTHDSNDDDGDERKNDRVLDEALAFFFGCK